MHDEKNSVPKEKMSFLKWIDNFWYHNKAAVIIGFVAFIVVLVCSLQMCSKKEPDVFIYFVGHGKLSTMAADEFIEDMEVRYAGDYNGDGRVVVDYKEDAFIMKEDESGARYVDNNLNNNVTFNKTQRFNLELGAVTGDCVIYIMEPAFFYANLSYIADLKDVLGYVPENSVAGKGFVLENLRAYKNSALYGFPNDYIICMARKKSIFSDEYYDGHKKFFANVVSNKVN